MIDCMSSVRHLEQQLIRHSAEIFCQLADKLINIFGQITESSFSDERICCCSFVDIIVNVLYFPFRMVD